jgi:hypothetical protein
MHVTLSPARMMSAATYERDYAAHFYEWAERDRAEKFAEYARYGVGEYWLIDPTAQKADFFSLQDGLFQPRPPDAKGIYTSPLLPSLRLPLALLWTRPALGPVRVVAWVAELCPPGA